MIGYDAGMQCQYGRERWPFGLYWGIEAIWAAPAGATLSEIVFLADKLLDKSIKTTTVGSIVKLQFATQPSSSA